MPDGASLPASAACRRGTKPSWSGSPYPAVKESPNATIWIGVCASAGRVIVQKHSDKVQIAAIAMWRMKHRAPYERTRKADKGFGPVTGTSKIRMNDISGFPFANDAIALSGVNLSLGRGAARVHILRDINLQIRRGEAVGLLGPSGSGKSTLLMVMTGLERPDTGSVLVGGEELQRLDEDRLARFRGKNVGIVFQAFHLIPTMTALENVAVPLELAGIFDALDRAAQELGAVGLAERLHHYPAELSGGEQQRVALARALAPSPAILVADEPTGNLDETTGGDIVELLFRGHAARGTTLVLVTHDTALAARCDRVIRLRSGQIESRVGAAAPA